MHSCVVPLNYRPSQLVIARTKCCFRDQQVSTTLAKNYSLEGQPTQITPVLEAAVAQVIQEACVAASFGTPTYKGPLWDAPIVQQGGREESLLEVDENGFFFSTDFGVFQS